MESENKRPHLRVIIGGGNPNFIHEKVTELPAARGERNILRVSELATLAWNEHAQYDIDLMNIKRAERGLNGLASDFEADLRARTISSDDSEDPPRPPAA